MAQRRMFSLHIVDSDAFLDMPQSAQLLYFHLSMRADDDGFVGNPKKIMKFIGSADDDFKVLVGKRFLLTFESGVIVIKHWRINNYIQNDRHNPTKYIEEKEGLNVKENGSYTERIHNVSTPDTQVSIGKVSIGKVTHTSTGVDFQQFWDLYPKKVERKKSEAKWNKLDVKIQETILADIPKRILGDKWSKDGGKYIEMPTTYLNGERWNDEIINPIVAGAVKKHII